MSALPALVAFPAWAARWDVHPTISADVTHTDNVRLARTGTDAQGDWVTQVTPGISVVATGAQLKAGVFYSAQFLNRAETGGGGVNHQLSANGNAELVKQLFFIDASASVGQQNVSSLAPQAQSNINDTGNRVTVSSFSVSPVLRHDFGTTAQGEARLTRSILNTSSVAGGSNGSGYGKSTSDAINLRLASGPAFKQYTWNATYSANTLDYDNNLQPSVTSQTFTMNGRRLITPQLYMTSSVGYEKSDYVAIGSSPSGASWTLGFDWEPTPRTRLSASYGKRYFGNTGSLDFSHRTRLTTWGAKYSENVTTTHAQAVTPSNVTTASYLDTLFLTSIPDPEQRQLAVQSYILLNGLPANLTVPLNFLTTQTQLVKRFDATFGIYGVRNTVLTNLFYQDSEALAISTAVTTPGDYATSNNVKQTGASVLWTYRISPEASASANASYTRSEYPTIGRTDNLKLFNLGVNRQFQQKVLTSLNYRGTRSDSSAPGSSYSENAVTAAVSYRY